MVRLLVGMVYSTKGAFVLSCWGDCIIRISAKDRRVFSFFSRTSGYLFNVIVFFIQFRRENFSVAFLNIWKEFLCSIYVYLLRVLAVFIRLFFVGSVRVVDDNHGCVVIGPSSIHFASPINYRYFSTGQRIISVIVWPIRSSPITVAPAMS